MVHAQAAHMINIYEIGDSDDEKGRAAAAAANDELNGVVNEVTFLIF